MKNYKVSQPVNWYKATWDAVPNPIVFTGTQGFEMEKSKLGAGRTISLWIFKSNILYLGYDKDDLYHTGESLIRSWLKNPKAFLRVKTGMEKAYFQFEKIGKEVEVMNLKSLSKKELLRIYERFLQKYILFWGNGGAIHESMNVYLQNKIIRLLSGYKPEIITKLTFPTKPSFLQNLKIKEIRLAKHILEKKSIKKVFKKTSRIVILNKKLVKRHPVLYKKFALLQKDYCWILNNYTRSKVVNVNFFIREIRELLKQTKWQKKNLEKMKRESVNPVIQKKKLIKDLKLSKEMRVFLSLLDWVTHSHDLRKRLIMKNIYPIDKILKEIAKQSNLDVFDLKHLTPEEIKLAFSFKKVKRLSQISKQRRKRVVFYRERGQKLFISSDSKIVQKYYHWLIKTPNIFKSLQGTIASAGQKVKGLVKTCLSVNDIWKVKKGNVLVASNTTPDYLPAIKKACAILTEKGGLTTHAAIVSRELRIPCLVGIPNVAEILKDGDLVEVDANKGIIKILKRK